MSSSSQGLSLISKVVFTVSLLVLFIWVVPNVVSYYKNVDNYNVKKSKLNEVSSKHHIEESAKVFSIEVFKKETASLFTDVNIEVSETNVYNLTVQVDKNKIKNFNTFIETLPLRYLVVVKDNELRLEEKEQIVEIKFTLEAF